MAKDPAAFDTLLRIRRRQEDLKAGVLATAIRAVQSAQEQRARIVEEQQQALSHAQVARGSRFDASEVRRYLQYERHLARLRDDKDATLRALQAEAEIRRGEVETAMKERRMVEKLRARKMTVWLHERRRAEQQAMDEVATAYAARGIRPPGLEPGHVEEKRTP